MTQLIILFWILMFSKSEAQSCITCSTKELRKNVEFVDGYYNIVSTKNHEDTTISYYSTREKYPSQRMWEVKNDTVIGYVLILRDTNYISEINTQLDKKYKKITIGHWIIIEDNISISLEFDQEENVPYYLYKKYR